MREQILYFVDRILINLPEIINTPELDHLAVFTRQPLIKKDEESPIIQLASSREVALPAFMEAINRKMDSDRTTQLSANYVIYFTLSALKV